MLDFWLILFFLMLADSSPMPVTPDYGKPLVHYADGVFDSRFNRYVTVQEGITLPYHFVQVFMAENLCLCFIFLFNFDRLPSK